jgi:hypothetical protein
MGSVDISATLKLSLSGRENYQQVQEREINEIIYMSEVREGKVKILKYITDNSI